MSLDLSLNFQRSSQKVKTITLMEFRNGWTLKLDNRKTNEHTIHTSIKRSLPGNYMSYVLLHGGGACTSAWGFACSWA